MRLPMASEQLAGRHVLATFLADRQLKLADRHPPAPPRVRRMDDTDRRLLALLRDDARAPLATLARQLGVSRATVQNRIARLRRDGVILGFTLRLRLDADPRRVRAIMMVAIEGKSPAPVIRALRGMPEVVAVHTTNGRWDVVAELRTDSLEHFDQALGRVRAIAGVAQTETSLLLSTHLA